MTIPATLADRIRRAAGEEGLAAAELAGEVFSPVPVKYFEGHDGLPINPGSFRGGLWEKADPFKGMPYREILISVLKNLPERHNRAEDLRFPHLLPKTRRAMKRKLQADVRDAFRMIAPIVHTDPTRDHLDLVMCKVELQGAKEAFNPENGDCAVLYPRKFTGKIGLRVVIEMIKAAHHVIGYPTNVILTRTDGGSGDDIQILR